ncbi:hypothetical protein B0H17DRAFT_1171952 [Mycena rosella]|uniref:Dienelactone hydrolase domain-containing protein n=1 Tax=Mycena rosella TaxID=1033263 RepID=A0AAD7CPJ5_MYCRO|nr:hypothetical protein B0H17DRAFT_1171952 [Mycena rosella]
MDVDGEEEDEGEWEDEDGVTHEGTPEGKIETIGGVECYIATPTSFGVSLPNNQLLAGDFAWNGFKMSCGGPRGRTIVPDYLHGDGLPADIMKTPGLLDLLKWLSTHGTADTRPLLDSVIVALKADGVTSFGATGYCFGGRYVFDFPFDGIVSAASVPSDLEKYVAVVMAPLLINSCENDWQFPLEAQAQAEKIFAGFQGYKREFFEGCTHGFAVRGDFSDVKVRAGKEGAFKATIAWILQHM